MESIKDFFEKYGKQAAIGGGIALSVASSVYLYKKMISP
jgi:hypothetical protein